MNTRVPHRKEGSRSDVVVVVGGGSGGGVDVVVVVVVVLMWWWWLCCCYCYCCCWNAVRLPWHCDANCTIAAIPDVTGVWSSNRMVNGMLKPNCWGKNFPQCHFVHPKSHIDY
jgi:hypothetical protein